MAEKSKAMPAFKAPEKYRPEVSFDEDDLPELKGWEVGQKYRITMEVEQTSKSQRKMYEGGGFIGDSSPTSSKAKERKIMTGSFKVLSVSSAEAAVAAKKKSRY